MTSTRTTLSGGAAILAALLGILAKATGVDLGLSDNDITTVALAIGIVAAGISGMFARDNRVSDQAAGVRPETTEAPSND